MKKIFIAMAAIFTMLLSVASPIMVKPIKANAASVTWNNLDVTPVDVFEDFCSDTPNVYIYHPSNDANYNVEQDSYVLYLSARWYDGTAYTLGCAFNWDSADVELSNNTLYINNIRRNGTNSGMFKFFWYYYNSQTLDSWGSESFKSMTIDLVNKDVVIYPNVDYTGNPVKNWHFTDYYKFETNMYDLAPPSLNLSITVDGAYGFGGVITRKQTDPNTGITSTADNLHFTVKNNGADAQWLFAIVPTGQSLDFEGWVWTGRENIIGNPTYCYASDEWITLGLEGINIFDSSSSANAVYCPSVWHPSAAGSQTGYSVAYESMNLAANQSYQIVVYGCLNPNLEEMTGFYAYNDGLGTTPNQLTSTYTVHGNIGEYEEVYRSLAFTMTDPATFNPIYTNSRDSSYAWDSNSDMKELFQNGSAYRDEDGNVRIKGFQIGSSTYSWENNQTSGSGSSYTSGSKNLNTQQAFGGFFNLFNWFLTAIPKDYQLVIFFGVVAIVVIAIIKAVK